MFRKLAYLWNNGNNLKYLTRGVVGSMAAIFINGSILQAFMLENGISEKNVAFFVSILQVVQVSVMLLVSPIVDRFKNIVKICGCVDLSLVAYSLLLGSICLLSDFSPDTKFAMILIGGITVNIIQSLNTILSYKVPFLIMDINDYGHLNGKIGIVGGITGALISALLSFLTSISDYNSVMLIMYIASAVIMIVCALIVFSYKSKEDSEPEFKNEKKEKKNINIFKYPPFFILLLPNLLRGFNSGIFGTALTIGYYVGVADSSSGATLNFVLQIATLLSSLLYTIFTKKKLDDKMLLISSIVMAFSMSFMIVGNNIVLFYVMYCIASFVINIINNAVPTAVMRIVDYDHIGQFTTWRMLSHTLGSAVAGAVVMTLIDIFGGVATLIFAALCQLVSGLVYYIYIQVLKKQNKYLM